MTSMVKKGLLSGLATLSLGASIAATSTPAVAQAGFGWGLGAGLLGGIAIGALATRPYYYPPPYPGCYVTRRPVYDPYGNFVGYRPVRACY